ncbi:S8 family serine peptidase [Kitasatospora sp. NPDC059646]|uniref:S8 family serine peptidase n=1 Tax=Kitasatospora sp. NPDC059646 TaxID=3346893 RepID=UPI00368659D7
MRLTRLTRALGTATLTAGFLFAGLPAASADQVRDAQWANQYFDLEKVWQVTKGDGVTVAVIDTGVDASHPDLTGSVLRGFDPGGQGRDAKPTEEHGTGMASLIAGHGHGTDTGMVGLAPGVKILPIYRGTATNGDAIPDGIKWAVDHGAKVINISQVSSGDGRDDLPDAVAYAIKHGVLVVAGSGNDGGEVRSPANIPGVLAVGAVDKNEQIWPKSNYGPEVMLTAPGSDIVMAGVAGLGSCNKQYCLADGTSIATAYVSAAAALVYAKFPNLTPGQVANRLVKSAAAPASGGKTPDPHYGYGVIQPYDALTKNIPTGSAQGPLGAPSGSAPSAGASAPGDSQGGSSGNGGLGTPGAAPELKQSSGATPMIIAAVGGVLVLIVVLIVIVVVNNRRRSRAQAVQPPVGGPAPYGAAPGWPPAQPPFGQQGPPGQQPPPYGYPPPQQPYNNPYQDGGQSR